MASEGPVLDGNAGVSGLLHFCWRKPIIASAATRGPAWVAQNQNPRTPDRSEPMRTTGTVKWFNDAKGYGFITPEAGDSECYVHHSRIQGNGFHTLTAGERVEFDLVSGNSGRIAENVVRLSS